MNMHGGNLVQRGMIVNGGRLQIPADMRRALGWKDGDSLAMQVVDGVLVLRPYLDVIKEVQEMVRPDRREGLSVVDELIVDRRAEAERD